MSGMTSERLEELRRIAEAATPGPWWVDGWEARTKDGDRFIASIAPAFQGASPDASCWEVDANIQHIATFDPPTALAMVAEIERLRRVVEAAERLMIALDIAMDAEDADDTFVAALDDIAAQEIIELRAALSSAPAAPPAAQERPERAFGEEGRE